MIIDCAHYLNGIRQSRQPMTLDEAVARRGGGGFIWLGMFQPGVDELDQVRRAFGLHELAVEDATFHLRPKVEDYASSIQLVVLRTACRGGELRADQCVRRP